MTINWKRILISILVGSVIAFLTAFLEGVLDFLRGYDNNIVGGAVGAMIHQLKHFG